MTVLYGIKNCDTVKKALGWLNAQGVDVSFVDFRKDGLSTKQIETWVDILGWDILINKRSTTWKQLSEEEKNNLTVDLVQKNPTLIKRPLLERKDKVYVGFKEEIYKTIFGL